MPQRCIGLGRETQTKPAEIILSQQTFKFDSQSWQLDCQTSKLDCQVKQENGLI
jgi:hypothetical protein